MKVIKKISLSDAELNSMRLANAVSAQICTTLDNECGMCPLNQCANEGDISQCTFELLQQAIEEMENKE